MKLNGKVGCESVLRGVLTQFSTFVVAFSSLFGLC